MAVKAKFLLIGAAALVYLLLQAILMGGSPSPRPPYPLPPHIRSSLSRTPIPTQPQGAPSEGPHPPRATPVPGAPQRQPAASGVQVKEEDGASGEKGRKFRTKVVFWLMHRSLHPEALDYGPYETLYQQMGQVGMEVSECRLREHSMSYCANASLSSHLIMVVTVQQQNGLGSTIAGALEWLQLAFHEKVLGLVVLGDEFCAVKRLGPAKMASVMLKTFYTQPRLDATAKQAKITLWGDAEDGYYALPMGLGTGFRPLPDQQWLDMAHRPLLFAAIFVLDRQPIVRSLCRDAIAEIRKAKAKGGTDPLLNSDFLEYYDKTGKHRWDVVTYRSKIQQAKYIICPQGRNGETSRIYEAFEAGSIPIVIQETEHLPKLCGNSLSILLASGAPMIVVSRAEELKGVLGDLAKKGAAHAQTLQDSLKAWWREYKSTTYGRIADAIELAGARGRVSGEGKTFPEPPGAVKASMAPARELADAKKHRHHPPPPRSVRPPPVPVPAPVRSETKLVEEVPLPEPHPQPPPPGLPAWDEEIELKQLQSVMMAVKGHDVKRAWDTKKRNDRQNRMGDQKPK